MYFLHFSDVDFKCNIANIMPYIQKRLKKNSDLAIIVDMTRKYDILSPRMYAALQGCQPTSAVVEQSFSMLGKLLCKDRNFMPGNVRKYLMLKYNHCNKE